MAKVIIQPFRIGTTQDPKNFTIGIPTFSAYDGLTGISSEDTHRTDDIPAETDAASANYEMPVEMIGARLTISGGNGWVAWHSKYQYDADGDRSERDNYTPAEIIGGRGHPLVENATIEYVFNHDAIKVLGIESQKRFNTSNNPIILQFVEREG